MPAVDPSTVSDRLEISDLCARYAMHLSRYEIDELVELFLPDGTYTAFGEVYGHGSVPETGLKRTTRATHRQPCGDHL